eukprot:3460203-Prymnesium_polylepis.1
MFTRSALVPMANSATATRRISWPRSASRRWQRCVRLGGGKEKFGRGRTHMTRIPTRAQGFGKCMHIY